MRLEYKQKDPTKKYDSGEFAMWAVEEFVREHKGTALDIGPGDGYWHNHLYKLGYTSIATVDVGDYQALQKGEKIYDLIWASHVLEHVQNIDDILEECFISLKVGGWMAIAVPPCRDTLTGGHHNFFPTPFHIMYKLIMAGFNCSLAHWGTAGNDQIVLVRKDSKYIHNVELWFNQYDIKRLAHLFPIEVTQGGTYR